MIRFEDRIPTARKHKADTGYYDPTIFNLVHYAAKRTELGRRAGWRATCRGFSHSASRVTSGPVGLSELLGGMFTAVLGATPGEQAENDEAICDNPDERNADTPSYVIKKLWVYSV